MRVDRNADGYRYVRTFYARDSSQRWQLWERQQGRMRRVGTARREDDVRVFLGMSPKSPTEREELIAMVRRLLRIVEVKDPTVHAVHDARALLARIDVVATECHRSVAAKRDEGRLLATRNGRRDCKGD